MHIAALVSGKVKRMWKIISKLRKPRRPKDDPDDLVPIEKIRSYFLSLKIAYEASPPLPKFLTAATEPLHIDLSEQDLIRDILIALPTRECLHLHSIRIIDSNDEPVDLKRHANTTASSHYGNSAERVQEGKLFDVEGQHVWAIHTARERNPWVRLSFDPPLRSAETLVINNRRDNYSRRAAQLAVRCSEDGESWNELYRLSDRDAFSPVADKISADHGVSDMYAGQIIQSFGTAVAREEYESARTFFRKATQPYKTILRDLTNEIFLDEKGLEWASHGARRSFRFWTQDEKVAYIELANEIIEHLRSFSPDVCFGFGSVLGPARDNDLIAHDDDIDIIIGLTPSQATGIAEGRRQVKELLEAKGYEVRGEFFAHWHVISQGFKVDVFVGIYDDDGTIGWYPGTRGALTREMIFPTRDISLFGMEYPIPRETEKYLEIIYTKNWRTPDPTWAHDWDPSQYSDIS